MHSTEYKFSLAWYQREIAIPRRWAGRRITVCAECLNSYAAVYLNGRKMGDMRFPSGQVEITSAACPGRKLVLSLLTVAMPPKGVMLSYNDTRLGQRGEGGVAVSPWHALTPRFGPLPPSGDAVHLSSLSLYRTTERAPASFSPALGVHRT